MNFYDELGLAPDAGTEDIRRAYHDLVRLLHPDQQRDERVRRIAECQMKRLNEMVGILTDPQRRRIYDRELALPAAAAEREQRAARLWRMVRPWPVAFAGAVCALAVAGWMSVRFAPVPPAVPRTAAPVAAEPVPDRVKQKRRDAATPSREPEVRVRRNSQKELGGSAPAPGDHQQEASPMPVPPQLPVVANPSTVVALPVAPDPRPAEAPPVASGGGRKTGGLTGSWLYVPPAAPDPSDRYPAEFIEMAVVEDGGALRGNYRARYRVWDRPISSEVVFRFEGTGSGGEAHLRWTGNGGSAGEGHLKLVSDASMEVSWWTTEAGRHPGLMSGRAVLVRGR